MSPLILLLAFISISFQVQIAIAKAPANKISSLRLVHMLYRHGDRAPVKPYPNDPYRDVSSWPVSWGQLTNEGKARQFKLGQFNRKYYSGFLSEAYIPEEISIRSTDVDRTLMSAEAHLAGLYPPGPNQTWNRELMWQPIPIHTIPKNDDLLLVLESYCPRYDDLVNELNSSPMVKRKMEENKELLDYLFEHSGMEMNVIDDVEYLYDTLFIEARYNKTLPEWTKKVFPEQMRQFSDFSFAMKAYTNDMQRLRGGPWVGEVVKNLRNFTCSTSNSKKLFMYSAHDVTLATVLSALKVYNGIQPPYASMILIELHELKPKDFFIQVLYKNVSDNGEEPFVLTLPGCEEMCPLDRFFQLTSSVFSDDVKRECKVPVTASIIVVYVLASTTCLLLFILMTCCLVWCKKERNGKTYAYTAIQAE